MAIHASALVGSLYGVRVLRLISDKVIHISLNRSIFISKRR